ncbi:hypothetical protein [Nonomuraea roseola]|uniref:hypothetical protein n=1 Tax=Nonomuraea roseola TaxID=46179 RepID=UPI0031F9EE82
MKDIVARFDTEVDAVFSAHTHNAYNCVINGIPVTQTSGHSREVTRVNLTVDRATGNPVAAEGGQNITVTHDIRPDMRIAALRRQTDEQAHQLMNRPVGMIARDLTATRKRRGGVDDRPRPRRRPSRCDLLPPRNGGAQIAVQPPYGGGIGGDLWVLAHRQRPAQPGHPRRGDACPAVRQTCW